MIAEIKNTILEDFQVRKSKKQKTAFIEYVQSLCEKNNINCTIEQKGINRNIVMGASPEECEMIVGGHYDTCAWLPLPNFITPKNLLLFILYQFLLTIVILGTGAIAGALSGLLVHFIFSDTFAAAVVSSAVYGIVALLLCILLMFGPANRHTANDNSSGTAAVLNALLSMTAEQRAKVCFVLFDNEEIGLLGSSAFANMHKDAKKKIPVINLDCVSDGDYLFARLPSSAKKNDFLRSFTEAMSNSAEKHGMKPVIGNSGFYPSDQMNFKRGIGIAALNRSRLAGLYISRIHTSRDTVFNDRNIDCITDGLLELVSGN